MENAKVLSVTETGDIIEVKFIGNTKADTRSNNRNDKKIYKTHDRQAA